MKSTEDKRRRDWSIIILILPLGVVMMMCVGQLAIRMSPDWSVSGDMKSSLDPESAPKQDALIIQPISNEILTPVTWWDTFLTPSGDSGGAIVFPPFITFEPSATVTATASATATPTTPTPTVTGTTPPPTSTPTKKPTDATPSPTPATCTDVNATNNGGPLPCVYPIPVSSTLVGLPSPTPMGVNDPPNGDTSGSNVANIPNGYYVIVTLTTPIIVVGISDTGYDLVYYERQLDDISLPSGYGVHLDSVILSISTAVNGTYYQVFNWSNGVPDTNSNLGDVAINTGSENDNQPIDGSEFFGAYPQQTGIQIDVDNAPSAPPPGNYSYLAIQAPIAPPNDGSDGADVDAIEVLP